MLEVFYNEQVVERKPKPYEYAAFNKFATDADIWHITNPDLQGSLKINFEKQPERNLNILPAVFAAAMMRSHEWTKQYDGRPLDHTIRVLYYVNTTSVEQQKMPLHHDFCVHTVKIVDNDRYSHSGYSELHNGVFADDFDPERDRHAAYCLPNSDRLLVVFFAYPGENYKDVEISDKHLTNIKKSDHNKLFDSLEGLTFGQYYETIFTHARSK